MGGSEQENENRRTTRSAANNDIDVKHEPEAADIAPPSKRVKTDPVTPKKNSKTRVTGTPPSKGSRMMDFCSPSMPPGNVKEGVKSSTIALFKEISVHSLLLFTIV